MPKLNHPNLGDVTQTVFIEGRIHRLHQEETGVEPEWWDTADVQVPSALSPSGEFRHNVPIFYHCRPDVEPRENGALTDAATGFDVDDKVILKCKLSREQLMIAGTQTQYESMTVIGHIDGPKRCRPCWILLTCTVADDSDEEHRYVSFYNIRTRSMVAGLKHPEAGTPYTFPCTYEHFEPWLIRNVTNTLNEDTGERTYHWPSWDLWKMIPVDTAGELEVAGGTPNWLDDFQGNTIRGGIPAKDWWTSYNFYGNPTFNYFWDLQLKGLLVDQQGIADGSFSRVKELVKDFGELGWSGPGARQDHRKFPVRLALGVDGEPLFGESLHQQVGYGEDEIWVCGRNSYQGIIVSYCDAMWKYVRFENVPPAIPIGNPHMQRLANGSAMLAGLSPLGAGSTLGSVGMALAADITQSVPHGAVILICATLKRLNEGMFHVDSHPALPGSFALATLPNPALKDEPSHITSLNLRRESANAWVRFDNWHNTLGASSSMGEANRTWWFRVWATQTVWDNQYWDTPIGSMFASAPHQRSVLWQSMGLQQGTITVRQDWPLRSQRIALHGQHEQALFQIYVSFRQGITLDGYPHHAGVPYFFRQLAVEEPWHCLPSLADVPDYEVPPNDALLTLPSERDHSILMPSTSKEGEEYRRIADEYFALRDTLHAEIVGLEERIPYLEAECAVDAEGACAAFVLASKMLGEKQAELAAATEAFDALDYVPATEYVGFVPGKGGAPHTHISMMSDADIGAAFEDHSFIHLGSTSQPNPLRCDRSEIEIIAASDTWGELFQHEQSYHPRFQQRDGALEKVIADLIQKAFQESGHWPKGSPEMEMEGRLL